MLRSLTYKFIETVRRVVCLKLQLPVALLALVSAVSENCCAASLVSDGDCEHATIEDICEHIGNQISKEVSLKESATKSVFDKDDGSRLNLVCTTRKRISLNLYNTGTGNIPLFNSALVGNRGLVISAFGLRHKDRRTINQTSGMFLILNKCDLLKSPPILRGLLFGDGQIKPQRLNGTPPPRRSSRVLQRRIQERTTHSWEKTNPQWMTFQ